MVENRNLEQRLEDDLKNGKRLGEVLMSLYLQAPPCLCPCARTTIGQVSIVSMLRLG